MDGLIKEWYAVMSVTNGSTAHVCKLRKVYLYQTYTGNAIKACANQNVERVNDRNNTTNNNITVAN